ncbi:MAG: hypothetical protein WC322_04690 [Candidatus Paceibacterota bacterium]|jgi:hypothetical protein
MAETIPLRSLSTGLVGLYPANHLDMDPDLVLATSDENLCVDCWLDPETVPVAVKTTKESKTMTKVTSNG